MTAKDLKFEPLIGRPNAPIMTCNCCGKRVRLNANCYMADYPIDSNNHVSFLLCDIDCLVDFHSKAKAVYVNILIDDTIRSAARIHFKGRPVEMLLFLTNLNIKP